MSYAKLAGLHPIYGLCESCFCYLLLSSFLSEPFSNYIGWSIVSNVSMCFSGTDSGLVPIFVYAIFGSSRQLAIGPVALVSLLVSNVLGGIVHSSDELYTELAILLAFMVGVLECLMGLLRYVIIFFLLFLFCFFVFFVLVILFKAKVERSLVDQRNACSGGHHD